MDVDVSLTTISSRIGQVHHGIASILCQDPPPVRVVLHLSETPWLLDAGITALPDALRDLQSCSQGRLEIRHVANTGPYRKLLPWLARHRGSDRLVVTADDDTLYPQGWLARLLSAWRPGLVVAHSAHPVVVAGGRVAPYGRWFKAEMTSRVMLALPIGKDGVLYRAADIPDDVLDVDTALRLAPTGDDLWFRWHMARCGVGVAVTGHGKLPDTVQGDSLWRSYNRGGGNDATIAALERHFAATYGFTMAGQGLA